MAKKGRLAPILTVLAIFGAILLTAYLVPASTLGISSYNEAVTVNSWDIPLLVTNAFGISGASASTTGPASLLDWALGSASGVGLELASLLQTTWTMTVCIAHVCSSQSASTWFPTVNVFQEQIFVTDHFTVDGVPGGSQPMTVSLSNTNGQSVSWSGTAAVG